MPEQKNLIDTLPLGKATPNSNITRRARLNGDIFPSMHLCFSMEAPFPHQRHQECSACDRFPDCIAEAREMRGRVFYDANRRPFFRKKDGSFDDPDPADFAAYHIIARWQGRTIGCARIVPPTTIQSGFIAATIGVDQFEEILRKLGTSRERICEASRWVVLPEFRGSLGSRIVAASWAVAHWLCFERAFVLACTCDKQDLVLIRMGARPINAAPLFPSRISHDRLRLLYFDVLNPSKLMKSKIGEMSRAMRLDDVRSHARERS